MLWGLVAWPKIHEYPRPAHSPVHASIKGKGVTDATHLTKIEREKERRSGNEGLYIRKALAQLIIDFSEQAADSSWLVLPFDGCW